MASIVDQFGRPVYVARTFAHAADSNRNRGPIWWDNDRPLDELIPRHDRRRLCAISKRLFVNMGAPMRAAIRQKADYSIGQAWLPSYHGTTKADQRTGREVADWLRQEWFPLVDVRGGVFTWHTVLTLASITMDVSGEVFLLKIRSEDGFPRVQFVPSYLVDSDTSQETVEEGGPYAGLRIKDGIIRSALGAPVAYRVQENGRERDIPASNMIHVFDPTFQEQGRGLPAFTHALDDLKSMLQSTEFERIKQAVISSILMVEKNELGGPDIDDPRYALTKDTTDQTGIVSEQYGPAVHYFRAGSGSGLETVTHDSPGDIWERFHDRLNRSALAGVGWSYSLAWKPAGQGTAERTEVEKARRSVAQRQQLINYLAEQLTVFAVAVASTPFERQGRQVRKALIPQPRNVMGWAFSRPPRLSVDDGREMKSLLESSRAGKTNDTEILGFKGRTPEEHYQERAEEIALRKRIAAEVSEREGIEISDSEMGLLTPNETKEPRASGSENNESEADEENPAPEEGAE